MKLLCFADAHLCDETAVDDALAMIARAAELHRPDLIVSLGDLFNCAADAERHGIRFRDGAMAIHPQWIFVAGNHDGGDTKGRLADGGAAFDRIFGSPQHVRDLDGRRLITLADQQPSSNWRQFALDNAAAEATVLSHGPLGQQMLDRLAARGVRLVVNGHMHVHHLQRSGDLQQRTLPPLRMAGPRLDPPGVAIIDLATAAPTFDWHTVEQPALASNPAVIEAGRVRTDPHEATGHFPGEPDAWQYIPPLTDGARRWLGGPLRLQCYEGDKLAWERRYGVTGKDICPTTLCRHDGREVLLLCGTWLKRDRGGEFESLVVVDPATGEEHYRIRVIGLSHPPTVAGGILYMVGQWREIIAVELATGRELWRQRSQVDTPRTEQMSWHDGRIGGGWSICQPAVAEHVWTVNSRGDLFGYDRESGERRFVHPAAVPANDATACTYAVRKACAPPEFTVEQAAGGAAAIHVNGIRVDDRSGILL